jgi:RHS repeat-associated protein
MINHNCLSTSNIDKRGRFMPPGTAFRGGAEGVGRDRVLCYCGEYYDEETGTYYLRARYYAPRLGRFTQEDSARDGLNWYVYCGNDPINFSDPDGQKRTGRNTRGGFTSVQSPEEFFDPNTNIEPIQGNIGSWKISGQAQLGYTVK